MEADFLRYYGRDLGTSLWGPRPLGARKLEALIGQLPENSATARALSPNAGWTQDTELLATIAELIDGNTLLHYNINKRKGQKSPAPIRIPRPWDKRRKKRRATPEETKRLFGGAVITPRS